VEEGDAHAPVVVLLHGVPGSVRDFRYLGPALAAHGLRAVRVDFPGFGTSSPSAAAGVRSVDRAAWLVALMRAMHIEQFAVVGHSFGGTVALAAAACFGDVVTALGLLNSVGVRRHRGLVVPHEWMRVAHAALQVAPLRAPLTTLATRGYAALGLRSERPLDAESLALHTQLIGALDFKVQRELVRDVVCPVFIGTAADDALVEPAVGHGLARAFVQAPTVTHLHAPAGGHFVQKSEAARIASWFARRLLTT
jgi:pimeloyl-ACP methyl ester carboxylesterase